MARTVHFEDRFEALADAVEALMKDFDAEFGEVEPGKAVDYARFEERVEDGLAAMARALHSAALRKLDIDAPFISIWGEPYRRMERTPGQYRCLGGTVTIERTTYRRTAAHGGGPNVDVVSVRAGAVGDGWLPRTARAMAHLLAKGTSREAEETAGELRRLPYSRSSFERVGHEVGALYARASTRIEQALIEELTIPDEAKSVSVSIDRAALPMEETVEEEGGELDPEMEAQYRQLKPRFEVDPRTQAVLDEAKAAAKEKQPKVARNWRMAYAATVTLHDDKGEALHTIRYGRMPRSNPRKLGERLAADVKALRERRPGLRVVCLADGAPEMWTLLDNWICERTVGVKPVRLLDLWHVLEYLGKAAVAMETHKKAWPGQHRRWRHELKEEPGAAKRILDELRASGLEKLRVDNERPVGDAIRYIENRLSLMQYADARRDGLPVGSGNVEATCKSLIGLRMKRPGARWKHKTGEEILHLRALVLSSRWERGIDRALHQVKRSVKTLSRAEAIAA